MNLHNIDVSLYAQAALYIVAGLAHFIYPDFFLKIMPKWVPNPKKTNFYVGTIEFTLGVWLAWPYEQSIPAWGIIFLLIAVFPANVYHFQQVLRKGNTLWIVITAIRLPLQGLLI